MLQCYDLRGVSNVFWDVYKEVNVNLSPHPLNLCNYVTFGISAITIWS